jgi:hypothetical protein
VIVIQLTELTADHAQLEPVVIETLPIIPVDGTDTAVGDTEYVHCASAGRASNRQTSANRMPQHRTFIGRPF